MNWWACVRDYGEEKIWRRPVGKSVKRFGETEVVRGIDLEIEDKEFVALVGPSGCGKSTTLRMIAGLEEPPGARSSRGQAVTDLAIKDRNIAMVFQSYALYPHMTVRENMAFGLKMRGVPKAEIDATCRRCRGDPQHRRSAGPPARASCRAVNASASPSAAPSCGIRKCFLFDEPLSNLDAKLRVQMRARNATAASNAEDDHGLRHPRPGRSDDDGRPHRRHATMARSSRSARRSTSTRTRSTRSWRPSWAIAR